MVQPHQDGWRDELREELHEFEQAAIEAEFETGRREDTVEEAKRHLLVRLGRDAAGFALCGIGLALMVLPGPGLVVLAAGLVLLAPDVPFARRLLERVRDRLPESESGQVSKSFIVASSVCGALFMGISLWWSFIR